MAPTRMSALVLTAAVNVGIRRVKQTAEEKMARVTGGMRLPPGLG